MKIKVFDIVNMLMEEMAEKDVKYTNFSESKMITLRNACERLDVAAEQLEATSVSADYDPDTDTFIIAMFSSDVFTSFRESPEFFDLFDKALSFHVEWENEDSICCMFTYETPWDI